MEDIFLDNTSISISYHKKMKEELSFKPHLDVLKKVTNEALRKEESLQETLTTQPTVFVHLRDQEILGIRIGSLEFCKEMLDEVGDDYKLEEVDKMVLDLIV